MTNGAAIITLGKGPSDSSNYAEDCALAARTLSYAKGKELAEAVRLLSNNTESNGALFIADALIILARIASQNGPFNSQPWGTA
jgi:hypothetical protein